MIKRRPLARLLLLITFTLLGSATEVWAQLEFPRPRDSRPAPPSQSYGWQIGLADGASILVVLGAAGSDSEAVGMLGVGAYVLGGPIVHSSHGHHGRAAGSLALRVGLPLLVAKLATGLNRCDPEVTDFCGEDDMPLTIMGGIVGVLAASTIDWFVLGREETKERAPDLQFGGVSLQPTLYPTDSGAQLGVVGQF